MLCCSHHLQLRAIKETEKIKRVKKLQQQLQQHQRRAVKRLSSQRRHSTPNIRRVHHLPLTTNKGKTISTTKGCDKGHGNWTLVKRPSSAPLCPPPPAIDLSTSKNPLKRWLSCPPPSEDIVEPTQQPVSQLVEPEGVRKRTSSWPKRPETPQLVWSNCEKQHQKSVVRHRHNNTKSEFDARKFDSASPSSTSQQSFHYVKGNNYSLVGSPNNTLSADDGNGGGQSAVVTVPSSPIISVVNEGMLFSTTVKGLFRS